jgi:hypothetical protein
VNTSLGLESSSSWTRVIRRPPAARIIGYIHQKWFEYIEHFAGEGTPFHERDEPVLTEGLVAFLVAEFEAGRQPFDGEFFAELRHCDLRHDGTAQCIGRTDIEWRLFGFPCFVVEFKILDGGRQRLERYVNDGLRKFVDGRYASAAGEGAMCAWLRVGAETDAERLEYLIADRAVALHCHPSTDRPVVTPSRVAPGVARFDTAHTRSPPARSPIQLAHLFIVLPAPGGG